jgi:N-acetyl sugar amidotransferase
MNTSDPDIEFDEFGVCNHCRDFRERVIIPSVDGLSDMMEKIKKSGVGRKYDCVIGLSGGLDSSYTVYLAWRHGLNALVVHIDNGWNTDLTEENIKRVHGYTGFDLIQFVLNYDEYQDLTLAYLKAGVQNSEIPFDNAIPAVLYDIASRYGIRYILTGSNVATESLMPSAWGHPPADRRNIIDIHKKFGTCVLSLFPLLDPWKKYLWYRLWKRIKRVNLLDYVAFNRSYAIAALGVWCGWQDHGAKNSECLYTKFDINYMLPYKQGFDKRRGHYSALIMLDQMTRDEAIEKLSKSAYTDKEFRRDYFEFMDRLNVTPVEFREIMHGPLRSHTDFKTWYVLPRVLRVLRWLRGILRRLRR